MLTRRAGCTSNSGECHSEVIVGTLVDSQNRSRLAQDLSHPLITMLQQECTRSTCPEMKAGEWLYLCVAHGNEGAMEVCTDATSDVLYLLTGLQTAMLRYRLHPPYPGQRNRAPQLAPRVPLAPVRPGGVPPPFLFSRSTTRPHLCPRILPPPRGVRASRGRVLPLCALPRANVQVRAGPCRVPCHPSPPYRHVRRRPRRPRRPRRASAPSRSIPRSP